MAIPNTAGAGAGDSLSPGDRVGGGRYVLKRLLGRGTGTEVWLAQDAKAGGTVALKFFPRAFLSDANLMERLKQDAQRLLLVKHPHIATTYELVRDSATMALAVEYVDGWSLAALKVDRLGSYYTVEEIEAWVGQLCEALEFAHHELGVVHSDLKPANLLINAQEQLKITDFEIAAFLRKESSRRGLVKGLYGGLGFLSPQQIMGDEPSKLDDIYSLGATIYDLLTGTAPFYKGEIFAQICGLKPSSMTARLQELEMQDEPISPVWEDTVARCLAKNPTDRPQSVAEVLELLKRTTVAKPAAAPVAETSPAPEVKAEVSAQAHESGAAQQIGDATTTETVAQENADAVTPKIANPPVPPIHSPAMVTPPARSHWPLILGGFALLIALIGVAAVIGFISLKRDVTAALAQKPTDTNTVVAVKPGSPGSVDTTFNIGSGANAELRALLVQPDGKILVAGRFNTFNGAPHRSLVRLNSDGTIDDTFTFQSNGGINALALAGDGGIFVAGDSMLKGQPHDHVMRLTASGGVDHDFNYKTKLNLDVRAVALQPDGALVVGGRFTTVNAKDQQHIMRFNPDGRLDDDFNSNVSTPATVDALVVQPDGKILVAGVFTRFNDADAGHLVRLNPSGTLDAHFNIGSGADGTVQGIALQHDGAIILGGSFTHVNGQPCPHLARLNPDGTVDATFALGAGADKNIRSVIVQPDGKIIALGEFTMFGTVSCHGIVRLNPDGSVDQSFATGTGASSYINCGTVQQDGKILLGGAFTEFNAAITGCLVRLNNLAPHP